MSNNFQQDTVSMSFDPQTNNTRYHNYQVVESGPSNFAQQDRESRLYYFLASNFHWHRLEEDLQDHYKSFQQDNQCMNHQPNYILLDHMDLVVVLDPNIPILQDMSGRKSLQPFHLCVVLVCTGCTTHFHQ